MDTPITQRLRRICQTGLAELVFPEAKTSRFVHSLGAMHLASRFLIAALENASGKDVDAFLEEVRGQIDWATLRPEELDQLLSHSGALDALDASRFVGFNDSNFSKNLDNRRLLALIEGALRLAALFHDLGHLPFSHDLEYAIKDFVSSDERVAKDLPKSVLEIANSEAPHEEIGHDLAKIVFRLLPERDLGIRHVYSLANKILEAPEPSYGMFKHQPASALQWLHSLVDGEIDVDRADYLLRDGRALGLDFAQYDLDRLVFNLVLVKTEKHGYITAIKETGLAALESYCLTRSRSHQVFVRHHKVAQAATALKYASARLMAQPEASLLFDFLRKLKVVANDDDRRAALSRYSVLDDGWWFQGLRALQSRTSSGLLDACLNCALDRAPSLTSVWKRKGNLSPEQVDALKQRIDELTKGGTLKFQAVRARLIQNGILFNLFRFKPYARDRDTHDSVMLISLKDTTLRPASQMSPLIRHLYNVWEEDIHLYAFVQRDRRVGVDDVLALMAAD